MLCGVDQVSYNEGPCAWVHCRAANPTGGRSYRALGSVSVGCVAGYSLGDADACVICPKGFFCVGGVSPRASCPTPSTTTAGEGATSAGDCICSAGYYTYPGAGMVACLPCDTSHWCPGQP